MMEGIWVSGHPATFATRREKEWKEQLEDCLKNTPVPACDGISMQFSLFTLKPNGQPVDIDNLCEPVFSVLAGKLGWFNSKRSNIVWWEASKNEEPETGLMIWPGRSDQEVDSGPAPDFFGMYNGRLPANARDPVFIEWVKANIRSDMPRFSRFLLKLHFGGSRINIADVSTGVVKPVIDCLFPVLGGTMGAPEDWRIDSLEVAKNTYSARAGEVYVAVWGYD